MHLKIRQLFSTINSFIHIKCSLNAQNIQTFSTCAVLRRTNNVVPTEKGDSLKIWNENDEHTWVGPPHQVSNLRLKAFPKSKNLTKEENFFYEKSREIEEWNQHYWEMHNQDFVESKKIYIQEFCKRRNLGPEYTLTMEEMADFYKQFLDKNHKKHVIYNWQWYRRNFELIYLSVKAQLSRVKKLFL